MKGNNLIIEDAKLWQGIPRGRRHLDIGGHPVRLVWKSGDLGLTTVRQSGLLAHRLSSF